MLVMGRVSSERRDESFTLLITWHLLPVSRTRSLTLGRRHFCQLCPSLGVAKESTTLIKTMLILTPRRESKASSDSGRQPPPSSGCFPAANIG